MRAIILLALISTLCHAQDPFDGAPGTDQISGMQSFMGDYINQVFVPAAKGVTLPVEEQFEIVDKLRQMADVLQAQLVEDLDAHKIDLYEFAEYQNKIASNLVLVTWYAAGLDNALTKLTRMKSPVNGTDLEIQHLEFGLNMIRKGLPIGDPKEVEYLTKIVNHPQFMRNENPSMRSNQALYLTRLANFKRNAGANTDASKYFNTYFQKIQTCDCANYNEVTEALSLYNKLPTAYKPRMASSFYTWYDQLALNPLGPSRWYTEEEMASYRAQMIQIIETNLNSSLDQ